MIMIYIYVACSKIINDNNTENVALLYSLDYINLTQRYGTSRVRIFSLNISNSFEIPLFYTPRRRLIYDLHE